MRFMTYNIRLGLQQGLEAIAAQIELVGPDVVALQEVGRNWRMGPPGDTTEALAALTGMTHHRYVPCIVEDGGKEYGHALLSKLPIVADEILRLPQEIDEPRAALVATMAGRHGPFRLITTHLSHIDDRFDQADALIEAIEALDPPIVLMGDLNDTPDAFYIAQLGAWLADADAVKDRPTFPSHKPEGRIDYLMARGGKWRDVEIGADSEASDHLWVAATLEI